MTAEGASSAEVSRRTSSRASTTSIPNRLPEGGPGPATEASRLARSASCSSHSGSASTDSFTSATERSDEEEEDDDDDDDEDDEEDHYERQRRQRMLENQSLLAELNVFRASISEPAPPPAPRAPRRSTKHVQRHDRYGYIVSLPPPGQRQVLAAIVVRTDRGTRAAIDAGEYVDCTAWAEGEERRWRFGNGEGVLEEGEAEVIGDVGPDFRWKTVEAVDMEQEREAATRAAMELGTPAPPPEPAVKKKYHYFAFDEEDRSFVCPVCLDKCNCKYHLEKLGLGHRAGSAFKAPGEGEELRPGETVQHYIERYIESKGREDPPFDRVRLVNEAEDVVAPPLTAEWEEWLEEQRCERLGIKRKRKNKSKSAKVLGGKGKGGKGRGGCKVLVAPGIEGETSESLDVGGKSNVKGKRRVLRPKPTGGKSIELVDEINAAAAANKRRKHNTDIVPATSTPLSNTPSQTPVLGIGSTSTSRGTSAPIFLRFRAPPRVREIDSDGDSVRGYSSDDSLESHSPSISGHPTTNDFLARLATAAAPALPIFPIAGMEGIQGMEVDSLQALEMGVNMTVDGSLPPVLDHLPPIPGSDIGPLHNEGPLPPVDLRPIPDSVNPLHMNAPGLGLNADVPIAADAQLIQLVAEPSCLRLTLAPAASVASPVAPHRRTRFAIPELSPPGHDPLPALYPAFPELGYAYSSYPMYSPYTFSSALRARRVRDQEREHERKQASGNGNGNGHGLNEEDEAPEPSRKRRPPPPAAHIVRMPKHLKGQIDRRKHSHA
ncbi:hypothetical protein CcaverHIS641_0506490 [Cutaneotrichosporon cavernicola]|nr:hypothetical protein CcaverHIS641_0506490 [Cutaneotrichosporon cavernicola]